MRVVLILLTLLLGSCAGPLVISPRRCQGNGLWTTPTDAEPLHRLERKVWTGVNGAELSLVDVFAADKLKCEDVGGLEVMVTQTTSDFLLSLIPFISRKTVTFNIYPRPVIMEVTESSTDN